MEKAGRNPAGVYSAARRCSGSIIARSFICYILVFLYDLHIAERFTLF